MIDPWSKVKDQLHEYFVVQEVGKTMPILAMKLESPWHKPWAHLRVCMNIVTKKGSLSH